MNYVRYKPSMECWDENEVPPVSADVMALAEKVKNNI